MGADTPTITRTGRCLCGAIAFTADVAGRYHVCHCSMCRRWAGGPYFAIPAESVSFTAPDKILHYLASKWGDRGSCRECGSALFWRAVEPDQYFLNAGALDDQDGLVLASEVFVDDQPGHYRLEGAEGRERLTGAEIFARHGASGE